MPHILIAGKIHPAGMALLEATEDITYASVTDPDPAAYLPFLPETQGLILRTQPLTAEHIAGATRLKIVARHGVGYDAVDIQALSARNIPLAIVGDVNSRTVAEHALMLLLAAARRVIKSHTAVVNRQWAYRNTFEANELDQKRLLIVGFGRIGRHLAGMVQGLGMQVAVFDPFLKTAPKGIIHAETLAEGLKTADCISVHVPDTGEVLFDAAAFDMMRPGVIFVNTSRGAVVDEQALAAALANGRVGACGLDVLAEEPPPENHPLLNLPNVILTPHTAGLTAECAERMSRVAAQNVIDFFNGCLDAELIVNS